MSTAARKIEPAPPPEMTIEEIFELQAGGRYLRVAEASAGMIDVPGCPELRIDLDVLWAYVARTVPPVAKLRKTAKK